LGIWDTVNRSPSARDIVSPSAGAKLAPERAGGHLKVGRERRPRKKEVYSKKVISRVILCHKNDAVKMLINGRWKKRGAECENKVDQIKGFQLDWW